MSAAKSTSKVLFQFYLLVIYVLLQFCWWAYLINNLNKEVHDLKATILLYNHSSQEKLAIAKNELNNKLHKRWLMIGGEGTVFISILMLGIYRTRKAFAREFELARQQKNFLLAITHELKSPIASSKLQIETVLKRKLSEEKQHEILTNALHDHARLNELVEKVLLANKIESSAYHFNKVKINVSELSETTIKKLKQLTLKDNNLELEIGANICLNFDAIAWGSIITNLLENASKYSEFGSKIKFVLIQKEHLVTLQIIDEGAGINSEEKKKVFKMFYRTGNEETRLSKGTGLGLYIVDYLVKSHQGILNIHNNKPKGSIFEMKFNA